MAPVRMMDRSPDVIDFAGAGARRLAKKAAAAGIEVRVSAGRFALYGPDRGWYLYPDGAGPRVRWLTYGEASTTIDHHIAAGLASS